MKKIIILFMVLLYHMSYSQANVTRLLELGLENAQRFSEDYFIPAGEVLINNMSNGWYTTARVKKIWHFEVGFVGNISFVRKEKQTFTLNTNEYENVFFQNGTTSQLVANSLGENTENIIVVLNQGQAAPVEVVLPNGISNRALNIVPSGFLQASLGISKSTEIKARFLPKIKARDNAKISLYGVGVQHELTDWIFSWKRLPFRISGLLGYTKVNGFYDFVDEEEVGSENRETRLTSSAWLLTGIISTKFKKLNFYGGFGFYAGNSSASTVGTYTVRNGPLISQTIVDPILVENSANGFKATFGADIKLKFLKANIDYTMQNYNNLSLGIHFIW